MCVRRVEAGLNYFVRVHHELDLDLGCSDRHFDATSTGIPCMCVPGTIHVVACAEFCWWLEDSLMYVDDFPGAEFH